MNKVYLAFLSFSFSFLASPSLLLKFLGDLAEGFRGPSLTGMLLLLLSHFSHVRLCVTP